jgi:Protein of unknown function (DUF2505)
MSIKFAFPADIEEVFELLTDPAFLVERNMAMGDVESECEVEETDLALLVKSKREKGLELPGLFADVLGGSQLLNIEEQWQVEDDCYVGSSTAVVEGQSGTVCTEFTLSPSKKGCEYEVTHSANIKIPLVGRKVEKFILKTAIEDAEKELDYLRTALKN